MWLLNTETLKLEEHVDPSTIEYAILSHTWEDDEVSFRDISDLDLAKRKAGYAKIAKTCELARSRSIRLAWVDTCCIDKSSSAELSEAINSMFQWYKLSKVCFAYLSDFVIRNPERSSRVRESFFEFADEDAFKRCKWFTRGWTLQELIAPKSVEFYDSSWGLVGTKSQLPEILESITRIPLKVLLNSSKLQSKIVAVKMSWAAQRQTKRIEDRAYSLLGIFDINMPLIYGEGSKAFRRLQEEIVKETNDRSLFAWSSPSSAVNSQKFRGIFADSPDEFGECSSLYRNSRRGSRHEYSLTNRGVRIDTLLHKYGNGIYVMPLALMDYRRVRHRRVGVYLVRTADGFVRSSPSTTMLSDAVANHDNDVRLHTIFIQKSVTEQESLDLKTQLQKSVAIRNAISPPLKVESLKANPDHLWDDFYNTFIREETRKDFVASLRITVCQYDKQSNEELSLVVTVWVRYVQNDAFAFIHSDRIQMPNRLVRNTVPEWLNVNTSFGNHVQPLDSGLSVSNDLPILWLLEKEAAHEVYFWDTESLCPLIAEFPNTAKFVRFGVQLETKTSPEGVISYEVNLTGEVSEMELGEAVKIIA